MAANGKVDSPPEANGMSAGYRGKGHSTKACGTYSCSDKSGSKWKATALFQCALSTRAGCECIAHALQTLTDQDPLSTVPSADGIGAYDTISRNAMLRALRHMEGGEAVLPFVLRFSGAPSTYLWEDSYSVVHEILQRDGGEQGHALMPALFVLGQHDALVAIQAR